MNISRLFVLMFLLLLIGACGGGSGSSGIGGDTSGTDSIDSVANTRNLEFCSTYSAPNYVSRQWHLDSNAGVNASSSICGAGACTGVGVVVRVVDVSVQVGHCDIINNTAGNGHFDLTRDVEGVQPFITNAGSHATSVAGLIGAENNLFGVNGVASDANIQSYNFIDNQTDQNLFLSMTRNISEVAVSNNSWGPPDDGLLNPASSGFSGLIEDGLSRGRGGLGTIYTWAAGNGALGSDNSNYDGFANYKGVLAIGSLDRQGLRSNFSERGANLWVSAPGGNARINNCGDASDILISTIDILGTLGFNRGTNLFEFGNIDYTRCFIGTSASTPIASGVIAQVLQSNPMLTWRDVREILARSAIETSPSDSGWFTNIAGIRFNHNFGFGRIDAAAATSLARTWVNVSGNLLSATATATDSLVIPDNDIIGVASMINITSSNISQIEQLELVINSPHANWTDLTIELIHEQGSSISTSIITETHARSVAGMLNQNLANFTFTSNVHFMEPVIGSWILNISDRTPSNNGTPSTNILNGWTINFYGR